MGFKFLAIILTTAAVVTSCSRSTFESAKTTNVTTFSSTPTCEEISETNGYIQWCNRNELGSTEASEVCYGMAYVSGQYRKILKVINSSQVSNCYILIKAEKNIFIPECDSAVAQTYDSLKGEENLNVFECRQKPIGILYIHAVKNTQKLFTVFSK